MGARLVQLHLMHDEIFAQAGDPGGCRGLLQIAERPLEVFLVGKNGKGRGAGLFQLARQADYRKVLANHSLGGGGLFQFRNHSSALGRALEQRALETTGHMLACLLRQTLDSGRM